MVRPVPSRARHPGTRSRGPRSRIPAPLSGRRLARIGILLLGSIPLAQASATPIDWVETINRIHPYAKISGLTDSNLTRRSDTQGGQADHALRLEAGFRTELNLSRQKIELDANVFRTDYARFSEFDHTGGQANILWKWVAGDRDEGVIGYRFDQRLRDFSNDLVPMKDMRDRHEITLGANHWLTPRWRLGGRFDGSHTTFSESKSLDKETLGFGLGLDYLTRAGTSIGLATHYSRSRFLNRRHHDYEDFSIGPRLDWRPTKKTHLAAEMGYQERQYEDSTDRDFGGVVGNLRAIWSPTAKSTLKLRLWREIGNLEDEVASHAVVDGISLEPSWRILPKTTLGAKARFERRDFDGSPEEGGVSQSGDRVDEVTNLELSLEWNPRRTLFITLCGGLESRDSNRELREYESDYLELGIKVAL